MDRMQVVFSASRNLYPYLPIPIYSLLKYNPDAHIWLMLEDDAVPYELPEQCTVVDVSKQMIFRGGANTRSPFTYLAMIRAAYPLIFSGENYKGIEALPRLDKVISLDCDVVICDSLQPIWETDLTGKWFAAVPEYPDESRPFGKEHIYRNCAVCVMNLAQMREDGVAEKAIDLLMRKRFTFVDEEVLNLLNISDGDRRVVDLPTRYNEIMTTCFSLNPAIVHAAGEKMVWQKNLDDDVFRGQYFKRWMAYAEEEACRAAGIRF